MRNPMIFKLFNGLATSALLAGIICATPVSAAPGDVENGE